MIAANYTEFRKDLKKYLDRVEEDGETLIVKRGSGEGTVTISMREYNAMLETMHLMRSKANAEHLMRSIGQVECGETVKGKLIDPE
ncbi:hypothetical protein FUAX_53570 (plasmid) [Fulvitalea axinellae]|uniref:Antitoxin n=1 Tax=Fulvitalea axinellae TaxID=1182444 RepID=A0AAU9DNZ3_9BACT|nr:hypothetical protein FUAX_53570 [Fulvitalea axinellae]